MSNQQEDKYLKSFGKRLAEVRKSRGLTQEELAERLDISRLSVAYLETGRRWPRLLTLQKIVHVLKINLSELFRGL
jgi:transcriptional regulator with XRE-family HTH domain